jgi:hypothetical protein
VTGTLTGVQPELPGHVGSSTVVVIPVVLSLRAAVAHARST